MRKPRVCSKHKVRCKLLGAKSLQYGDLVFDTLNDYGIVLTVLPSFNRWLVLAHRYRDDEWAVVTVDRPAPEWHVVPYV